MSKKFIQKKENFVCENCGEDARGDGYTNHCPKCLWSKHVDINPGDRANECGGMMKPVSVIYKKDEFVIKSICVKCDFVWINKAAKNDSEEVLQSLFGS
ncbi:MAG: RNHCP domain-containing protein [bacterium]|nr:RNHCP domain-containing protein [bacterium]